MIAIGVILYLLIYFIYFFIHYKYLSLFYYVDDFEKERKVLMKTSAYKFSKTLFSLHDNNTHNFDSNYWVLFFQSVLWPILLPIWLVYYIFTKLKITDKHSLIYKHENFIANLDKISLEDFARQLAENDNKNFQYNYHEYIEKAKNILIETEFTK